MQIADKTKIGYLVIKLKRKKIAKHYHTLSQIKHLEWKGLNSCPQSPVWFITQNNTIQKHLDFKCVLKYYSSWDRQDEKFWFFRMNIIQRQYNQRPKQFTDTSKNNKLHSSHGLRWLKVYSLFPRVSAGLIKILLFRNLPLFHWIHFNILYFSINCSVLLSTYIVVFLFMAKLILK